MRTFAEKGGKHRRLRGRTSVSGVWVNGVVQEDFLAAE